MPSIAVLPAELRSQIAAGEVVERPASVVKELVENALDASATRIQVEVGGSGTGVIRVTDDGTGMTREDAQLSIERHATSKIVSIDDLMALRTHGFRGEALPSIASVSRFVLRTQQRGAAEGTEVATDGGAEPQVRACGMAPGTVVEVRDLFFNVPARRKFLKSPRTEAAAITSLLDSLALSVPEVSLTLLRDGRPARQWLRMPSREQRALVQWEDERLAPMSGERGPMRVEAFLGPPERARTASAALVLLVNGRVVRDRLLSRTVAHAYGSVLEPGRFPVGVVYVDIEPQFVDVNVHPQKAEVRFSDARAVQQAVFSVVSHGVSQAFGLQHAFPSVDSMWQRGRASQIPSAPSTAAMEPTRFAPSEPVDPWGLTPQPAPAAAPSQPPLALSPRTTPRSFEDAPSPRTSAATRYASLRFITQLRQTYLLCESTDGLVLLDQHAAAERVAFARLRAGYEARSVLSQKLLLPVTFTVGADEVAFLEENAETLVATGLELRPVGPNSAGVYAVPALLSRAAPERLARDLLDEARREGWRSFSGSVDKVLATMACHGSVRAGEPVSAAEAQALIDALDTVDHAGHCPHGRPVLMTVRYDDLAREVGRR